MSRSTVTLGAVHFSLFLAKCTNFESENRNKIIITIKVKERSQTYQIKDISMYISTATVSLYFFLNIIVGRYITNKTSKQFLYWQTSKNVLYCQYIWQSSKLSAGTVLATTVGTHLTNY